ncbi:MAG: ferric reductase-like transmembrane domain-containing protein [Anaeromyxobacteraceae bacterium]|nr:ferric reductase-like transmembrane domain-containing protein [Anaeromyxobacteraceae bacterium]
MPRPGHEDPPGAAALAAGPPPGRGSREALAARRRWIWRAALLLCLAPLLKLPVDALTVGLTANPVEAVQLRLGFWTLTFLAASLAATPLHDLLGLDWPLRLRRLLGLAAFGYGALHLLWWAVIDQGLALDAVAADVAKRPFVTVGLAALLLLLPLAVTSTDGWVRRLGFRAWKRLHRLAYPAALLGVVHFLWRVKADRQRPLLFAAVIGALLLARLLPRRARPDRRGVA